MSELRIDVRRRADALHVRGAVRGSKLEQASDGWVVSVRFDQPTDLPRLLGELQACLDENDLTPLTVTIDDAKYLMESRRL